MYTVTLKRKNRRPFQRRFNRDRKPHLVVREAVAARLGCSESKVRDALRKQENDRRIVSNPGQQNLAAVLLDLSSYPNHQRWLNLRAQVLDSLYGSDYALLAMYYLLQQAHAFKGPITTGEHDDEQVIMLCKAVCPNSHVTPFSELIRTGRI